MSIKRFLSESAFLEGTQENLLNLEDIEIITNNKKNNIKQPKPN